MTPTTGFLWAAVELVGNHLWQSTLFAAVAGFLTLAFRRNRAQVRYWLWLAASVKFLVPFAALVAIGGRVSWRSAASIAQPDMTLIIDAMSQPFSQPAFRTAFAAPAAPSFGVVAAVPILLLAVWLGGCALILAAWCGGWRRVTAALRDGSRVESGREVDMLRRLQTICGIRVPIALVSTNTSLEPGVFGVVRPVLLWSRGVGERLADAEVEAVLAHEVCHVRRRDNLAAAVHMVVEALFWFHPLVWWVGARLVDERERACDEEVVRLGSEPQVYAESILKMCAFYTESPLGCVAGVTGADLKKRIEAIVTNRIAHKLSARKKLLLMSAAVAAVGGPIAVGVMNAPRLQAQSPTTTRLTFEVASVKANKSGPGPSRGAGPQPGGRYTITNVPLDLLIAIAYQPLQRYEMDGVPDWIKSERFDIDAKADGNTTPAQTWLMLQSLLAERFKLVVHRETRQLPVYSLVTLKSGQMGPQLRPHTDDTKCVDPSLAPQSTGLAARPAPGKPLPPPPCGAWSGAPALGRLAGQQIALDTFGRALSGQLGRMVLDRTGLSGAFDLTLEWTPQRPLTDAQLGAESSASDTSGPSIFTAVQEQLGLKLVPETGPVNVLVIDRVERPSDN